MVLDLTSAIPAITSVAVPSDAVPGMNLPAVSAPVEYAAIAPDACAGCRKVAAGEHKPVKCPSFRPLSHRRQWFDEVAALGEEHRQTIDMIRTLIHFMHLQAHGILAGLSIAEVPPYTVFQWPVVAVSGSVVTVRYTSTSPDPRAVEFQRVIENPDWGTPGENRYITEVHTLALRMGGVLTFLAPSSLAHHAGWIVYHAEPSSGAWADLAVDDTFELHVLGSVGSMATTPLPSDSEDPIMASVAVYNQATCPEDHFEMRQERTIHCMPLTLDTIASPSATDQKLTDTRCTDLISATWKVGGGSPVDCAATIAPLLRVEHGDPSGYETWLDLSAVDTSDKTDLTITLLEESASTAAIACGQGRCANSVHDPTGTWGVADGDGTAYCRLATTASKAATFKPDCYQTACSGWTRETSPTNPANPTLLSEIIASYPWLTTIYPWIQEVYLERFGVPSLASLTIPMRIPQGVAPHRDFSLHTGGWARRLTIGGLTARGYGLQRLEYNNGLAVAAPPDHGSPGTWPPFGPAGGNKPSEGEIGEPMGPGNDPVGNERSAEVNGSVTLHPYTGGGSNTLGQYQRMSARDPGHERELWFPRLTASRVTPQEWDHGTLTPGAWNEFGVEVESGGVYNWKLTLTPGTDCWRDLGGDLIVSGRIKAAEIVSGKLVLYYYLGTRGLTYPFSDGQGSIVERYASWRQGGNIVAPPPWARVLGIHSPDPAVGIDRAKARAGHVVKFTDDTFPDQIKGRSLLIDAATPFASSTHTQSFVPEDGAETLSHAFLPGRFFVMTGAGETVQSITITRNSGAVTLTERANNQPEKPYDLTRDEYYWQDFNASGLTGVLLYFSADQGDSSATIHELAVEVVTDVTTHNATINILNDANSGWDTGAMSVDLEATADILSIDAVRVIKQGGEVETLSEIETEPADWPSWEQGQYYVPAIVGSGAVIIVSPEYSMDRLEVDVTTNAPAGSSLAYYDAHVAPAGERSLMPVTSGHLPRGHRTWACRCDSTRLVIEGNVLEGVSLAALANKTVEIRSAAVAKPESLSLWRNSFNSDDEDEQIEALIFAAEGTLYFAADLAEDDCLFVRGRFADRRGMVEADADINSLRRTVERIAGE